MLGMPKASIQRFNLSIIIGAVPIYFLFVGTNYGAGVSLQTYCCSRREEMRSFSNGSFTGRGMTFSFCSKGDIITFTLTNSMRNLDKK